MKYISLIIFTIALAWTWHLVHSEHDISFETHSGIQEKLAALIMDTIKAKRPSASEVVIEKIWTEVLSAEKVKAFFVYSFKDVSESGPVNSEIQGEGLLERKNDAGDDQDHWVLTQVHTTNDAIQFEDATIVTGSENSTDTESTAPSQENSEQPDAKGETK
jgi:hypothetical protein